MTISFYKRPESILCLDDDSLILEGLSGTLPTTYALGLYTQPEHLIAKVTTERQYLNAELAKHLHMAEKIRNGESPIAHMLAFWRGNGVERFNATGTLVIDYCMPSMNGLQMLGALPDWKGNCVLLTGQADEAIAIAAFNDRLIQQYIPKHSNAMFERLLRYLNTAPARSLTRLDDIWHDLLSPNQQALLEFPEVAQALTDLIAQQQWVEYVLLGRPFGVLGMRTDGVTQWLQIEDLRDPQARAQLAELAVEGNANLSSSQIESIKMGAQVMDLELRLELRSDLPVTLKPSIALGCVDPRVVGAVFTLGPEHVLRQASWGHFLSTQSRQIHM